MTTISYIELQKNLEKILQKLAEQHEPIKVTREGEEAFILMPLADYEVLKKTLELPEKFERQKRSRKKKGIKSKLDKLRPHNTIIGDPDELIDLKVYEWNEEKNL